MNERFIVTTFPINRALEYSRRETVVWDRHNQRVVHTYRRPGRQSWELAKAMADKLNQEEA